MKYLITVPIVFCLLFFISCENEMDQDLIILDNEGNRVECLKIHGTIENKFLCTEYDSLGRLYKTFYSINDTLQDTLRLFYHNGNVMHESIYINGKKNGPIKGYYENGNLKYKGYAKMGLKTDIWTEYDEFGYVNKYKELLNLPKKETHLNRLYKISKNGDTLVEGSLYFKTSYFNEYEDSLGIKFNITFSELSKSTVLVEYLEPRTKNQEPNYA